MFLTKYGNLYLNKLLAIIMLSRASQMLCIILVANGQLLYFPSFFKLVNPIFFAAPACSYLYIKGFIRDESNIKKTEWLHFIPFLLAILDVVPWFWLDADTRQHIVSEIVTHKMFFVKESTGIISSDYNVLARCLLFSIYLVFTWRIVIQSGIIKNRKDNPTANNWILILMVIKTLVNLNLLITIILNFKLGTTQVNLIFDKYTSPIFSLFLFVIIGFVFYNPKVLYGYVFLSKEFCIDKKDNALGSLMVEDELQSKEVSKGKKMKGLSSAVLAEKEQLYMQQIITFMETQKPYLNPDFSITLLSQETNIPIHHCSYILNYIIEKPFRDWINGYRIEHFIQRYSQNSKSKTILGLSIESGFKNKVTFYNSFMKAKGVSPTDYFKV